MSWFTRVADLFTGGTSEARAEARAYQERVTAFRQQVTTGLGGDRSALEALLRAPESLQIRDEDAEIEIERVHAALDLLALRERVDQDGLPVLAHQHKVLADERCHFIASAFLVDDMNRTGRLMLTSQRLVFVTSPVMSVPWAGVRALETRERDLLVLRGAPGQGDGFRCNSFSDARCAAWIGERLRTTNGRR